MTAVLLDAVRIVIGFALGYETARAAIPCPVCGHPAIITGLCARWAPVVNPRRRSHE